MYTFCSFLQLICNLSAINLNYKGFIASKDNVPSWKANSTWEIIKSLSALAKAILASNSKLLDWMTSRVVLVFPESYSRVIPSFAISAAFNWDLVASRTLLDDWYFDQEFEKEPWGQNEFLLRRIYFPVTWRAPWGAEVGLQILVELKTWVLGGKSMLSRGDMQNYTLI